ncbi:PAS domain S-box protein [Desulfosporosinus sp.]|uniref:PAS domain S-box protein n=1 Tax=Desulfosporosinus sp. TaxID=157907 RepID=UPI0025C6E97A|nr:PAS domain S-box protein [Desulfosporosinus sp.]MBC2726565.1 PAS domain S-box protein [Desulfosporosinus sp.]
MSKDEEILDLKQRIAMFEETLVNAQEDNEIWDRIFNESYWGMMVCDAISGDFLKVNPCYAEMHGYSSSELIKKTVYDVFAPECHKDLPAIIRRIHEQGHCTYKTTHIRKDGSRFPVHTDSYAFTYKTRLIRVVSVWDLTESELKEKELRQYREGLEELVKSRTEQLERTNEQLRSEIHQKEAAETKLAKANQELINTLESISDGFYTIDRQWVISYVNNAMVKALEANGINSSIVGTDYWETFKYGNTVIKESCLKAMRDGQQSQLEIFECLMGHWVECSIYPTESGVAVFSRNINERKKNEKIIKDEHHRLYTLFERFPGLICIQEENFKIRFANKSFKAKFGSCEGNHCYEAIAGLDFPCKDCLTPIVLRNSTPLWNEVLIENRTYEVYIQPFTDIDGSNLIFKVLMDITDRKKADRELARLERLNMVGEMAAGIAHEVRNPLTTVRGFLQLLDSKDKAKLHHEFFDLMIQELDRANLIITDFLSLAKEKSADFTLINLKKIIESLVPLLSADALNQDKEIILELEEVPNFQGNENELRQLLLNLVRNGLEAMNVGSILTIKTNNLENCIFLKVCDQGSGVDPMIFEKLGTPFLTTKERGTGLGLAICQRIAARHNAVINFESNPTGTTVTVKFYISN